MDLFWTTAALELSEASAKKKRELTVLLPALRRLLHDSGVDKSVFGASLGAWVQTMQAELASSPAAGAVSKTGWLRKQSRSGLSSKLRWVVLDGSRLMYYPRAPDGLQDAPLKGVLQLHGGARVTTTPAGFTVEAGPIPTALRPPPPTAMLGRNAAPGATAASPMLVVPELVSPGAVPDPVLNPLHVDKQRYVWMCGDAAERDAWVSALSAASVIGSQEAACLHWSARFAAATHSAAEYVGCLADFRSLLRRGSRPPLAVPADWVRVHMATGGRRPAAVLLHSSGSTAGTPRSNQGSPRRLSPPPSLRDSVAKLSGPSGGTGSMRQLLQVASPQNDRVTRVLSRAARRSAAATDIAARAAFDFRASQSADDALAHAIAAETPGTGPAAASSASPKALEQVRRLEATAESSSLLHDVTQSTIAATEASAQGRRMGHTPGDRVDPLQLDKDVCRDVVVIDGETFSGAHTRILAASLVRRVMHRVSCAVSGARGSIASIAGDAPPAWASEIPRCSSRLVDFAREVLLCSSRTVIGGDSYDAIECVFRPPDGFRLQQVTQGDPIHLSVSCRETDPPARADVVLASVEVVASCAVRYRLVDVENEAEAFDAVVDGPRSSDPDSQEAGRGVPAAGHAATLLAVFDRRFRWEQPAASGAVTVDVEWLVGDGPVPSTGTV